MDETKAFLIFVLAAMVVLTTMFIVANVTHIENHRIDAEATGEDLAQYGYCEIATKYEVNSDTTTILLICR